MYLVLFMYPMIYLSVKYVYLYFYSAKIICVLRAFFLNVIHTAEILLFGSFIGTCTYNRSSGQ